MKMPLDPSCWQWSTGGALRFACFPGGGGEELLLRRAAGGAMNEKVNMLLSLHWRMLARS
jgi:hypothetical protein